jgi:hypothetical protein
MMASFRSFLSRRQTDRTTLTFDPCVFSLKQLPQFIPRQPFTDKSPREQAEKRFAAVIRYIVESRYIGRAFRMSILGAGSLHRK